VSIDEKYKDEIEEYKNDILLSLRLGVLQVNQLKYLLEHFKSEENYEGCQGLANAYAEFKQELDEY
jgi:hypothetical protein